MGGGGGVVRVLASDNKCGSVKKFSEKSPSKLQLD
jgi:hypothetical protein